jgi:hypothetical protein
MFCTLAQNAMVSKDIINKLAPLLSADDQEATKKLKRHQAMLEVVALIDINHRARHSVTPQEPSISSSGSSGNHHDRCGGDLHDIICSQDLRGQIDRRRRSWDRE